MQGEMVTEPDLFVYLTRVLIALGVLSACAVVLVRYSKRKNDPELDGVPVKVLASLPLGRDVFFVVRCGPDVLALASGGGGTRLMGRWTYEEWLGSVGGVPPRGAGEEG